MYRKSARRSRPPGRSTRIASSRTSTPARRVSSAANGKLRAQPLIGRRVQDKSTGASYGWRHERCQPQTRRGASWPAGTSSGSPRRTRHTPPAPGSEPLTRWDLPAVVQPPTPGTPVGVDQRADQRLHRPTQPSRHHRRGVRPQPAGGTRTVFPVVVPALESGPSAEQERFCVMARRSVTLANQLAGVVSPMLAESGPHARGHTWVSADSITRDRAETAQSGSPWFGRDFIADCDGLLHGPRCSTAGPVPPADSHDHQLPDVPTLASTCA